MRREGLLFCGSATCLCTIRCRQAALQVKRAALAMRLFRVHLPTLDTGFRYGILTPVTQLRLVIRTSLRKPRRSYDEKA